MGNKDKVPVEGVGTYRLILGSGNIVDLYDTLYVPLFSRNLLSVTKLDDCGFVFKFGSKCFSLYKNNCMIGCGNLIDGLYKLELDNSYVESLITVNPRFRLLVRKGGFGSVLRLSPDVSAFIHTHSYA